MRGHPLRPRRRDACDLIASIASVCDHLAIIDTHVSLTEADSITWRDRRHWGSFVEEHPVRTTGDQIWASLWHSLDNLTSFNFTRNSLCNLLRHVGFTSVFKSLVPYEAYHSDWPQDSGPLVELGDRVTLVAIKGKEQKLLTSPPSPSSRTSTGWNVPRSARPRASCSELAVAPTGHYVASWAKIRAASMERAPFRGRPAAAEVKLQLVRSSRSARLCAPAARL